MHRTNIKHGDSFSMFKFLWQLVFMVERYGVTGVGGRAIGWRAGLLVRDYLHNLLLLISG